jgi:hypothetical protein
MKFASKGYGAKETWWIDGQQVTKAEYDDAMAEVKAGLPKVPEGDPGDCGLVQFRPLQSMALSVHPKQVEQANARNKRHGVGVEYRPDGMAIITSRNERKRLLKVEGMRDNQGGYGD